MDWLLVGLGNPGPRYVETRHNAGFLLVEHLARRLGLRWKKPWFQPWEEAVADLPGGRLYLQKPLTYMNLSGRAVRDFLQRHPLTLDRVMVAADQLDLPPGTLRFKARGSEGGHRGLLSMTEHLGSPEYPRLWIGIGRPPAGVAVVDWVLGGLGEDRPLLEAAFQRAEEPLTQVTERGASHLAGLLNARA